VGPDSRSCGVFRGGHRSPVSVALDTMILIWGGLRRPVGSKSSGAENASEMEFRSRVLIRDLEDKDEKIIIPAISVAELLTPLDAQEHGDFIAVLTQRFFCPPFDVRAASLSAQLWQYHRGLPPKEQLQRSVLKADVLIVAVARLAGATTFYSHDAKCRKLAERAGMKAKELPTHSENLFTNSELKNLTGKPSQPASQPKKQSKKK
jgi:predicted nucleic acid-binding protein